MSIKLKKNKPVEDEVVNTIPKNLPIENIVTTEVPVVEVPVELGYLGTHRIKITKIDHVVIEGREYNKLFLANGTTELLSDVELAKQLVK